MQKLIVINSTGTVNKILTAFGVPFGVDYTQKITEFLRNDWEPNLYGVGFPKNNPSSDPREVRFGYTPTMLKQQIYANLPYNCGSYEIIDAFVCGGERFGLDQTGIFVEVCKSEMGGGRIWANVYLLTDSEIPSIIIKVEEFDFFKEYVKSDFAEVR